MYHDLHGRNDPKSTELVWWTPHWRPSMASARGSAHCFWVHANSDEHFLWQGSQFQTGRTCHSFLGSSCNRLGFSLLQNHSSEVVILYEILKNQLWYIVTILHYYYHNTSFSRNIGLQLIQKEGKIHLCWKDLFYNNFLSFLTDIQQRGIQVLLKDLCQN